MKRVLVIAYYFPPMGMGGVQRAAKFTKYLPDFGWEPIVITVKDSAYYAHDPDLAAEISSAQIIRTESLDPLRLLWRINRRSRQDSRVVRIGTSLEPSGLLSRLNAKLTPWFFVPDSKLLWLPFAIHAIRKICRTQRIDAVFTSSPPHSAHLIGLWLRMRHGMPWIADFRDDWMTESYEKLPTPAHRALNDGLARRALRAADRIVAVSPQIAQSLSERRGGGAVVTLYNGFDAHDFENPVFAPNLKFTVTYTGTLNHPHDPEPFFIGLRMLLDRNPDLESRIQIRLVGSAYGIDLETLKRRYRVENIIQNAGYFVHAESVCALTQSDLLLLILSPHLSAGSVTGKIFEYLASGKPILAVAPESEATRLIEKHQAGRAIHPHDAEGLVQTLLYYFRLWETGKPGRPGFDLSHLKLYERREQTRTLAGMLDEVSTK